MHHSFIIKTLSSLENYSSIKGIKTVQGQPSVLFQCFLFLVYLTDQINSYYMIDYISMIHGSLLELSWISKNK